MLRQKRRVDLTFVGLDPASIHDTGSRLHPGALKVRVHGHRLTARWPPESNFDAPPVLRGRVRDDHGTCNVTGIVRETTAQALLPFALGLVAVIGVILIVLGATGQISGGLGIVLTVMGVVVAVVFSILFIGEVRRHRRRFDRQAGELEAGVSTYVRTGETTRPTR